MCGIAGIYHAFNAVSSSAVLAKMRDQMVHRGPDGAGIWYSPENNCALAHRRLSIIDLSAAAAQPMLNQSGTIAITFNGEIYNHAEIRAELQKTGKYHWNTDHSDTEVLLHAYEEWNLDAFNRFYGMFAVAIFDRRIPQQPVIHLVRDRIGVKPLYISQTGTGEWLFASEIKALLVHPDLTAELNKTALWHYLTFIVAPAPMTMFKGIWKIPAGHGVTIDAQNKAKAWQWWDCQPSAAHTFTPEQLSFQAAEDELLRLLRQSIQRRMVSDVPFGVLLSGGVDSSLNVALMSELMSRPVSTFTIGYDGQEENNEYIHARKIANRYKTDHHEISISENQVMEFLPTLIHFQDEPIADNVCIPLFFLSKLVKENKTTVVQVGEGADENLLGYWWCEHYLNKFNSVYQPAISRQASPGFSNWMRSLFYKSKAMLSAEDLEITQRARLGEELFWGGAVCWWGKMRNDLTPNTTPYLQQDNCPVDGLFPSVFHTLNSHEVVKFYLNQLKSPLADPAILQKIPYLEHKIRLPEHLLMRVDKMTMAHSIEARVPFLDHELVEFLTRLPAEYKMHDGHGKYLLKKVAEKFIDKDLLYRKKQGFGAPMEKWFHNQKFYKLAEHLFETSELMNQGFFDKPYCHGLLKKQVESGGYSFHLWTIMNALLWYECWIKKNFTWI